MNKHLEQIITLAKIDKEIDAYEPKIERIKSSLNKVLREKDEYEKQITQLENDVEDEKLQIKKNELHLAELTKKLEDAAKKTKNIKTEKEMKALQLEEEIAKEQIGFSNEEIARHEKIIDTKTSSIEELKDQLKTFEDKVNSTQESVENELETLEKERAKDYTRKQDAVSKMNQKGLVFYERIRRWAGDTTAVKVKKQACYGCYIKLSDKTYAEVISGEDIITCPNCGRILYIESEDDNNPL